jgi:translation initiation factor IF-1
MTITLYIHSIGGVEIEIWIWPDDIVLIKLEAGQLPPVM